MDIKIENIEPNIEVEIVDGSNYAKAICYYKGTPKVNGKEIGSIGELETNNTELGIKLLNKCEEILKEKGCMMIVGPMNGNTWKKYRTLTYTTDEPEFILENVNPIEHNQIFEKANFEKLYTYTSTKGKIDDYVKSKYEAKLEEKIREQNINIRTFNKNNYIEDLKKIYEVAKPSFFKNPFYTPISKEDFLEQYIPYVSMFDEDLILIAEKDNNPVGFVFALPNFDKETIVVKTGVVLDEYQKLALGNTILSTLHDRAKEKGYKNWIFAFMYQNNTSQKSAKRHNTKLIREYALYGKNIEGI